jgi:hypothetical protein
VDRCIDRDINFRRITVDENKDIFHTLGKTMRSSTVESKGSETAKRRIGCFVAFFSLLSSPLQEKKR